MSQSHISLRNLERLRILAGSADEEVARLAKVVREIGVIRPYKKKRLKFLAKDHRKLFEQLEEVRALGNYAAILAADRRPVERNIFKIVAWLFGASSVRTQIFCIFSQVLTNSVIH